METANKQWAMAVMESLPDDMPFEELVYQLVFRAHLQEGLQDIAEGRTVPQEEVEREFAKWLKSAGQ
jgi:predicted transcriptional regulator